MKIIDVVVDTTYIDEVNRIASAHGATDYWLSPENVDNRQVVRLLVTDDRRQEMLDALQEALPAGGSTKILVIPIEAVLPREKPTTDGPKKVIPSNATREELYNGIEKNSHLSRTYLLLVFLSTVVAGIGLLENNVSVVIGAMVIAPFLGPIIALSFAAALGDSHLMGEALKTNLVGLALVLLLTIPMGKIWPSYINSPELLSRTIVGLDSIALALASGAAGVLSLTTGLSSVLVGVMVAVALLPPTATFGIMLGAGKFHHATGAGLLLSANIVSVSLSAVTVFLVRGIKPRTWWEKAKARQSMTTFIGFWICALAVLLLVILYRE